MVLSRSQLGEPCHDCRKIIGVCFFKPIQKLPDRASASFCLVKFYRKFHRVSTSNLMYITGVTASAVDYSPLLPEVRQTKKGPLAPSTLFLPSSRIPPCRPGVGII